MKRRISLNSTVTRIFVTVIAGFSIVALAVSAIVINLSKNIFIDTYGKSQERVFQQIEKDFNDLHEKLMKISSAVDSSWAFRLFLESDNLEDIMAFQTLYQLREHLEQALSEEESNVSIMVLGLSGVSFINRDERITTPVADILNSSLSQSVLENPDNIQYQIFANGWTSTSREGATLIGAKALTYLESKEPYAIIYFIMRENDVEAMYDYFTGDTTDLYLLSADHTVVSSNKNEVVGTSLQKEWLTQSMDSTALRSNYQENGKVYSLLKTELPYYNFTIYGMIDNAKALDKQYNIPELVLLCAVIASAVLVVIFMFIRQITYPLSDMTNKMSSIREGDFSQYMEVQGTEEVKELAITYNYMLDDLKRYIEELMHTQEEKRLSEIKALQMQINPHYVYNTLASIKWLIWQGDAGKSTQTIDAFIKLLRNTISNTNEFITVDQEIDNLKNYVLINQTRYGDQVHVEFNIGQECNECILPKLILQPFIENAFFHAFPSERKGIIQVSVARKDNDLNIQIMDNGIGMDDQRLESCRQDKSEHFSGIGINNVNERLKLLYGDEYGVTIVSKKEKGTNVSITLPIRAR